MYNVLVYHHIGDRSDVSVDRLQPHFETDTVTLYEGFEKKSSAQNILYSLQDKLDEQGWTLIDVKRSITQDFYLYSGVNDFSGLPEYYEIRLIYV